MPFYFKFIRKSDNQVVLHSHIDEVILTALGKPVDDVHYSVEYGCITNIGILCTHDGKWSQEIFDKFFLNDKDEQFRAIALRVLRGEYEFECYRP